MIINTNHLIEGHSTEYDVTSNYSSRVREKIQQCRNELNSVMGLDYQTIDHILRDNILKAQLLSELKNQTNPNIVNNSGNYNQEIIDMLTHLVDDVTQERIDNYDGDKDVFRDTINKRIEEDTNRYGNRLEVITKGYLDRKYKALEEQYDSLLSTNQCEEVEKTARRDEQNKCDIIINKKTDEIHTKDKEIKDLGKKIVQNERIKTQMKKLKNSMKRVSGGKGSRKGYCNGRIKGRHPQHCGGRATRKNECERTYKNYRGKNIQCQWNTQRRSCDFWQSGKPYTKKYC